MNWKEFLRPTVWKLLVFTTLIIGIWFLAVFPGGDYFSRGFPLTYYEQGASQLVGSGWNKIHYMGAGIDVLFWYSITCGIFSLCKKKSK